MSARRRIDLGLRPCFCRGMLPLSPFSRALLGAAPCPDGADLAQAWFDQTAVFLLNMPGHHALPVLGAHLRRSFLGALSHGASAEAQGSEPCPWDPPCALDIFCREQIRDGRGNGLPKPYVVFHEPHPEGRLVGLRVFGAANDWFMRAAEGFAHGLTHILPWQRAASCAAPRILRREIAFEGSIALPPVPERAVLEFLTPFDAGGRDVLAAPSGIVSRLVTRVSRMAMWSGATLDPDLSRALSLSARDLRIDMSRARAGRSISPNRQGQKRQRDTVAGAVGIAGDLRALWPVLVLGARCHLGRGAVEGLGRYHLRW